MQAGLVSLFRFNVCFVLVLPRGGPFLLNRSGDRRFEVSAERPNHMEADIP